MINYIVEQCERNYIKDFVEENHYSKNINGVISDYCFALMDGENIVGAAIFGRLAMAKQWCKYAERQEDIIELRRLCCIDDTPKNTESYFIARCIKWLRKNTQIKLILSYADATHGHTGVIYRASNFEYHGMTAAGRMIMYHDKLYHDKTIRTKYKDELKPFALAIKTALETGEAEYIATKGKHIYTYKM